MLSVRGETTYLGRASAVVGCGGLLITRGMLQLECGNDGPTSIVDHVQRKMRDDVRVQASGQFEMLGLVGPILAIGINSAHTIEGRVDWIDTKWK